MPIKIIEGLPVKTRLEAENVFTIDASRAMTQDIRPLRIVILNLMPKKEETELHLLRLLGNTPLQVDIEFLYTETHKSKNTPTSHLQKFYRTLDEIKDERFDGMIITGAPVEKLDFNQVDYIEELEEILKWSETHVFSRFFICWGAQFALNYYYDFDKITLPSKLFGIFKYKNILPSHPLMRGFDDQFEVPQSRHTRMDFSTLDQHPDLKVLSVHPDFGPDILSTSDSRDLYIFGHLEYERDTLRTEYERDVEKGLDTGMPHNYFPDDDSNNPPYFNWKSHGHLLFNNWLNETYQNTYYDLNDLGK
ncbi:homoserine O-succinyltransferase [Salinicoccus halitifaciens]|uniref:Homoserine O-acetyltransferase n=1 Tax=Salinicoccus halitifaciens TaxID=1073415 RepID=A0ABV2EAB2_9STAP|nr:homoserine O-succinyltransferase [Salinicoccus halitifaciens]MCD2138499.1 homoserine O-succinyltransferase [Salinicoccus halitifaciens]